VADESDYSELEREELEAYCRTLPAFVERDGIEYESPNYITADAHAAELAGLAFDKLQVSRAEDVREDDLIDAAIDAGLYILDRAPMLERLRMAEDDAARLRELIADHARGLLDLRELIDRTTPTYA
jgi:hypothetical protein